MAQSRRVRVFISSTFRDMQAERDHLMRVVFPELEQRCMEQGISFVPVDLRWGVTREEAESGEALRICIEAIEECRPFFLCLLGERYGWVPLPPEVEAEHARELSGVAAQLFAQAYHQNPGYEELLLRAEGQRQEIWGAEREANERTLLEALTEAGVPSAGQSITAQEVYHGVLCDPEQQMHSLFYFRDTALTETLAAEQPEGFYESTDEGRQKLAALKQSITEAGLQPETYGDIERLGGRVLDQLWDQITHAFPGERPAPPDPLTEERRAQELFVDRLTRFFVGREDTLAALDDLVVQGGGYVAVTGASGCGKTALLANWLHGREGFIERHPQTFVLSHFIGASTQSANAREILTRFCRELASLAEWTEELPLDFSELSATFSRILEAAGQRQPILIAIDALDQLEQADNAHSLNWLPGTLPEGITLVASSLGGSDEPRGDEHRTWPPLESRAGGRILRVPLFERPNAETMAVQYLGQFRKRLSPEQLAALMEKNEIGSPLYVQVALDELRSFGEYEAVTDYIRALPGTIPEMYAAVLEHLEREHGQAFMARAMSCLACGRYGMTEAELLSLAATEGDAVAPLKWARLHRILSPHLLSRGDVLGFYHRQLREAVERRYVPDEQTKRQTHADIARHLESQPLTNRRKLEEQPYQLTLGAMWDELLATLTDYLFLDAKLRGVSVRDLIEDYERAVAAQAWPEGEQATSLRLIGDALRLSAHILAQDPDQLPSQLFGRLQDFEHRAVQSLLAAAGEGTSRPWLQPLNASLARPGGALLRTLRGHSDSVNAVAVTSDSHLAVSASSDGTLKVWELATGAELRTLSGHSRTVLAVALTPDGRLAVSGSGDNTLKVWDVATGAELRTLSGHSGGVSAVAMAPDGRQAVSGSWDGTLKVWDVATGAELRTLGPHDDKVSAVVVTPDGRQAISASLTDTLKAWDLATGAELPTLDGQRGGKSVAVTPDGRQAISGSLFGASGVWDLATGVQLRTLGEQGGVVSAVTVTPDGRQAISGSWDEPLRVWDLATGAEVRTLGEHAGWVNAVGVTPDGRRAVSASWDGTLKVWDLAAHAHDLSGHRTFVKALAVTPDGGQAVSASMDSTLKVWDLATGTELYTLGEHSLVGNALAISPDGRQVISAPLTKLEVWDLATGEEQLTLGDSGGEAVAVTPDGRQAISGGSHSGEPGKLTVWDLGNGAGVRTLTGHSSGVTAVAVTADGRRAVSGGGRPGEPGELKVWELESGAEVRTLAGHSAVIESVAVTADGRRAVSASGDHTLKVWDLESGAEVRTLTGHSSGVSAVAVTADGRRVVSAASDKALNVWDLETGELLCTFTAESFLSACATAPDGQTIVAGDWGGHVHFLRLENVTPGPPICTAWLSPDSGAPAFGCLHCRVWSEVSEENLGAELPCPNCGRAVKLNEFVIAADWRPVAAAWRRD